MAKGPLVMRLPAQNSNTNEGENDKFKHQEALPSVDRSMDSHGKCDTLTVQHKF